MLILQCQNSCACDIAVSATGEV